MLELLNQIVSRSQRGESLMVCVLVETRGSTPQKAGAIMVVLGDGKTLGTIGGGCVEAEVRTRALKTLGKSSAELFEFQLNHDLGWDDGLVCGGSMSVAVVSLANDADAIPFANARDHLLAGKTTNLVVGVLNQHRTMQTFSCPLVPSPRLLIAGAGHVGMALAEIARQMEFDVTVIDDRAEFASHDRFPSACRHVGDVETELAKQRLDEHTYVVIVTRGHRGDTRALSAVVKSNCRYIGLIGSKRKIVTIYQQLLDEGVSKNDLKRVHAPIGMDIGAVSPAEIAVSIAAQLVAVRRMLQDPVNASMRLQSSLIDRI